MKIFIIICSLCLISCTSYDLNSSHAYCHGYGSDVSNLTSTMSEYDRFRYQSQNGMSLSTNPMRPVMHTDCYRIDPKQTQ